jgi:hypothetical protein
MAADQTPIALFVYNRPDHTQSALNALSRCERLADCHLVIYCDGPKTPVQEAGVAATRQIAKSWAVKMGAQVVERTENLGLARSIVTGVTEQCQICGRVIVVEDDLVVSPDFLSYMLQALDRFKDNSNVYQISGFMFPVKHPTSPDAFFLPLSTTWGWATWERAWRAFTWDVGTAMQKLADPQVSRQFDLDGSFPYTSMLRRRLEARNDSWGILWWYTVFNLHGLVLHPRQSLVWNGGFDNSGIHSGAPKDTMQSSREEYDLPRLGNPLLFPQEVKVDQAAFIRLQRYLKNHSRRRGKVMSMLRRFERILVKRAAPAQESNGVEN